MRSRDLWPTDPSPLLLLWGSVSECSGPRAPLISDTRSGRNMKLQGCTFLLLLCVGGLYLCNITYFMKIKSPFFMVTREYCRTDSRLPSSWRFSLCTGLHTRCASSLLGHLQRAGAPSWPWHRNSAQRDLHSAGSSLETLVGQGALRAKGQEFRNAAICTLWLSPVLHKVQWFSSRKHLTNFLQLTFKYLVNQIKKH